MNVIVFSLLLFIICTIIEILTFEILKEKELKYGSNYISELIIIILLFIISFYVPSKLVENYGSEKEEITSYPLINLKESDYVAVSGGKYPKTFVYYKNSDNELKQVPISDKIISNDNMGSRYIEYKTEWLFLYKIDYMVNID